MLMTSTFRSAHRTLALSLLVLCITAFGSAATAQSNEPSQVKSPDPATNSTSTSGKNASGLCERPEQWLWAETYQEGEMAFHGSKVWKAIEKTNGDMPGMNEPSRWELVDDHCSIVDQ
ncbi:MAG: hypothetical protein KBT82_07205 [Marinobacter sp.]|uniref:hypothetical protein n=1 Tax=Marinobacter sp. TaxID=50741 RepID=UPI001B7C2806|nr:hypothetical protein [Marinobacter sp.]MBQ0745764.1 hypothetical protein [Marinobacter sp.]MBQ0813950.1 hypothetical protein [Marinobacter sp.]